MSSLDSTDDMDLKATVALECIIQGASIIHTMQRFDVFTAWNERLFHEVYEAYLTGRAEVDPANDWYFEVLSRFDQFVIPLALRLKESGLFGFNGDEYIKNARKNRKEWETKGPSLVSKFKKTYNKKET